MMRISASVTSRPGVRHRAAGWMPISATVHSRRLSERSPTIPHFSGQDSINRAEIERVLVKVAKLRGVYGLSFRFDSTERSDPGTALYVADDLGDGVHEFS
jgi:hypothetical protein